MTDARHPMLTNLKEANPDLSEAHLDEIHALMSRTLEVAPHVGHLARHAGDLTRVLAAVAGRLFARAEAGEDLDVEDRAALQQAFFAGWRPTYTEQHVTGEGGILVSCFVPVEGTADGLLLSQHAVVTGKWLGPQRTNPRYPIRLVLPLTIPHGRIRLPHLEDSRDFLTGQELVLDRCGLYFEAVSGLLLYNPRDWLDELTGEEQIWLKAHLDWPPATLHPMGGPEN